MEMGGTGQGQAEALPPKAANTLGHWVTQAAHEGWAGKGTELCSP